jgi:uncharacterized protein YfaS (alpha-2-macroglobulin family)
LILTALLGVLAACVSRDGTSTAEDLSVAVEADRPQLVRRSPMEAERLSLAPVIELTFDRDMDRPATAAAWSFSGPDGQDVPGRVSWPDARTLRFTPGGRLSPESRYLGVLETSAVDASGQPLADEIRLDFRTASAFVVGSVLPADGAADVEVDTSITVAFNRPVVPLVIVEEQDRLPQPLQFSPQVAGRGEWVNSSMYVFQPDEALSSGAAYTVRVEAGLADVSGSPLDADHVWSFSTRPVSGWAFGPETDRAYLDQTLSVSFAQPMDQESVAAALTVEDRETGAAVPVKLQWSSDASYLRIDPVGRYRIASFYHLRIDTAARARSGGNLEQPITLDFSTWPRPRVVSVFPGAGSAPTEFNPMLSVTFGSPMRIDSLKGRILVSPELDEDAHWFYNEFTFEYYCYCLRAGTDYIVRVRPGAADIYGNVTQGEHSFSFTTGDFQPRARLLAPGTPLVYRAGGEQAVFFEYTNLDWAQVSLYPISSAELGRLILGRVDSSDFSPAEQAVQTWQPEVADSRNHLARILLDFRAEDGSPLPPGYYFLGLDASPFDYETRFLQGVIFMVATDNLTLKVSPSEALAWLVDLETGRPTPNVPVVIYNRNFLEIGRAMTDADGLVYLDGLKNPAYARTDDPDRLAFVSQEWGSGISTSQYGMWANYYADVSNRFAYVYTERPVYRPGQEVFFTGIVRRSDDLHYSLPFSDKVYVTIEESGEKLYAEELVLSDRGSFDGSFRLGEEAALGSYVINVSASPYNSLPFGGVSFRVAEYHKPEFQLTASLSPSEVLAGDEVLVDLSAQYYSGASVANAQVYWYMESTPYYFYPVEEYQGYSFTDWDRDEYWSNPELDAPAVLAEGSAATDEDGRLPLEIVSSLGPNSTSRQVQFYADVTDLSGSAVGTRAGLVVHQSQYYAGIASDRTIGTEGEPQTFDLVVLDWASSPVAGRALSVEIVERRWYSVQEQNPQGQVSWTTSVEEIPAASFTGIVSGPDGRASVTFTPQKGGIYKAVVRVRDAQGRAHQAAAYLWAAGSDYIPWRQTNDRSFSLVADRDSYAPGETAEILIAQPFEGPVYALVTVERGHVYRREVLQLEGSSTIYRLPVTGEMVPAAYVSVVVMRGAEDGGPPDFRMGMTRIDVDTSLQALDVRVTADHTQAGPGETVVYTIQVRDAHGDPVQAELSVALVDKAALALAEPNSAPILEAFYSVRSLNVATAVGIVASADDFNANYEEIPPDGTHAGGGGGKGVGDEGIIDVREEFRDTAFFQAGIRTDADGRARVSIQLPENLTTWRLDVRAATAGSLVGQAAHELVSTKAVFAQLQTPRFFVAGDRATVGATIFNNSPVQLQVRASLEVGGVRLLGAAEQTVEVLARRQAYLTWDVEVETGAERVDLTVHTASGSYQDASKPPLGTLEGQGLPVYSFHVTETVGTSGLLRGEGSVTEAIQLPASLPSGEASLSVEIVPSLAASIQEDLTYLEDFPYLCMEQTVSRFLPNLVSARILSLSGRPDPALQEKLDQQVNSALQRIYARQRSDGGWEWWGEESDALTSAYVLLGLLEARQAGYQVAPRVITDGIEYLKNHLPILEAGEGSWQANRHAFLLYVLSRADALPAARAVRLFESRDRLSLYGKAYLAQSIHILDPENSLTDTLMAELSSAAILSAAGAHWEEAYDDYRNWNSDRRTTAIILDAFVRIDPENPITVDAVRWLAAHRRTGPLRSTQETAWTLMALSNWLAVSRDFDADYAYAVGLNGSLLQQGAANSANLSDVVRLEIDVRQMLADEINHLVVTRGEGPGNLYYAAYLEAALPVAEIQPLDQGIVVSRQYFRLGDDKTPVTEVARGEIVQARVTVIAPAALHYVIVNDALPAGLEALDASLLTDVNVPSAYTRRRFQDLGWGWWLLDHLERRDERVVLSADYLPAGTYVFTYQARASTVGVFNVLPVTAQEFYFPDVAGRGAGGVFVVTP